VTNFKGTIGAHQFKKSKLQKEFSKSVQKNKPAWAKKLVLKIKDAAPSVVKIRN
jgi:hypothetical protein